MMTAGKLTREQFKVRQLRDKRALEAQKKQVLICAGTGCIAGGSLEIYDYIQAECQRRGMEVHISLIHEGEPGVCGLKARHGRGEEPPCEDERLPRLL